MIVFTRYESARWIYMERREITVRRSQTRFRGKVRGKIFLTGGVGSRMDWNEVELDNPSTPGAVLRTQPFSSRTHSSLENFASF
ncbi:hypothetical protein K443DRAFT_488333 [Laccaria amethystina LaAM-08-1]|uniref:Uncharacterized protein n=1 Tax=Laccaria amethystina LaAM-08-1 TaxID=1095629 RepID=A0A0C9Y508_9AGAR|nr:hypothetical protein K443DRAFT_488333 [Laccaria amethystina LaAM-08-1]